MLLDFFASAPSRAGDGSEAELAGFEVSFGDATQVFHCGPASCAVYGVPAGMCEALARWGSARLEDLVEPAARLAREGVLLNAGQAYVAEILSELLASTPECAAIWAPAGRILREGEMIFNPELGDALRRLARRGRRRSTVATSPAPCATGSAFGEARSRPPTSRPMRRSRARRCGCPTATARSSPTRRRPRAARCSRTRSRCWTAGPPRRGSRTSSARWPPRRTSGPRSSWRGSHRMASWRASSPRGSARPRTSR